MPIRLACLLLIAAAALSAVEGDGAGAWMEGKWLVVSIASKPAGDDAKQTMTMRPKPGSMVMDIAGHAIATTMVMPPKGKVVKRDATYAVERSTADTLSIRITGVGPGAPVTAVEVRRDGANLVLTDDGTITTLAPYDEAVVAKQAASDLEAAKPAAPVKAQPLSGTVAGQAWTPLFCRRSHFQFDESGKRIRVEATVEKLEGFAPGTKPKLLIQLPIAVGEYPLGPTFNITVFTPPSSNETITNGVLHVIKAGDDAIEFSLSAHDGDGNQFNGHMVADITPLPRP